IWCFMMPTESCAITEELRPRAVTKATTQGNALSCGSCLEVADRTNQCRSLDCPSNKAGNNQNDHQARCLAAFGSSPGRVGQTFNRRRALSYLRRHGLPADRQVLLLFAGVAMAGGDWLCCHDLTARLEWSDEFRASAPIRRSSFGWDLLFLPDAPHLAAAWKGLDSASRSHWPGLFLQFVNPFDGRKN